jgi:RHS repeat-associated protein
MLQRFSNRQSAILQIANRYTYTGREWDETLGLHHFRARWMSPLAGRFLGRDPIEYRGSKWNLNEFGQAKALSRVDPSGKISVIPLHDNFLKLKKCEDPSEIYWDFHLDDPAPCDGYIIQKVTIYCNIEQCNQNGGCTAPSTPVNKGVAASSYFEVWPIKKDNWIVDQRLNPKNMTYTDRSRIIAPNDTCGFFYMTGEIKFYCENPSDDPRPTQVGTGPLLHQNPVTVNACGLSVTSGVLPGTTNQPSFWDKPAIEGPATRGHGRIWACCQCQGIKDTSAGSPTKR